MSPNFFNEKIVNYLSHIYLLLISRSFNLIFSLEVGVFSSKNTRKQYRRSKKF